MMPLKNDHLVEENQKKQNIVTVPCSSRKDEILIIWYFHATTINNNMAYKKMIKN